MNSPNSGGGMRNSLRTIARGLLQGLGFGIALAIVYVIAWQWEMKSARTEIADMTVEASTKDIMLSDVQEQKHDGVTYIIGTAKNTGKKPARSVEIQANLFLHGEFVDQYKTYISGRIEPGTTKYFKIACGCKDSPPAEHDSFKVEVSD